jgi:hypothetical protein
LKNPFAVAMPLPNVPPGIGVAGGRRAWTGVPVTLAVKSKMHEPPNGITSGPVKVIGITPPEGAPNVKVIPAHAVPLSPVPLEKPEKTLSISAGVVAHVK